LLTDHKELSNGESVGSNDSIVSQFGLFAQYLFLSNNFVFLAANKVHTAREIEHDGGRRKQGERKQQCIVDRLNNALVNRLFLFIRR